MKTVLLFLAALPELVRLAQSLLDRFDRLVAVQQEIKEEKWIQYGLEIAKRTEGLKTDEERAKMLREMARHRAGTP